MERARIWTPAVYLQNYVLFTCYELTEGNISSKGMNIVGEAVKQEVQWHCTYFKNMYLTLTLWCMEIHVV